MIELKKKQELANIAIGKLDKKIKDLELLTTKLNERINEESFRRNELKNNQLTSSENNNFQIKTIKDSIEQLATIFNTSLTEMKTSFNEEINDKTSSLKEIIDEKSKLIDEIINNKKNDNLNYQNSFNDFGNKFENFEKELNEFKNDLKEKNKKIENFEKTVSNDHSFFEEQIGNINKQFMAIEKDSIINKTFKTNINKNIADIESEIRQQNEIINKIKLDYDSYMNTFESKLNKYYENYRIESDKLIKIQEDIYTHIDLTDNKLLTKIKELSDYFNKEITLQQNEIENFEKYIMQEHSHFSDFFQEKLKGLEQNMNKNISFIDADNKQLKIITKNLKEENENLKVKINENINELNKFHNKKNDTILKILMNNNLVPPDFDYKSFCAWNYSGTENDLISSSNRNNYNNNLYEDNIN
jgi:chromosome segregation ATPase